MVTNENKTSVWLIVGRVLFTFALVATICFVFGNSLEDGVDSSAASEVVLEAVQDVVSVASPSLAAQITETIIRKIAHVCEYMLVGFWMMLCLRVYTKHFVRHITWPMFGGLFIALVDETIQLFSAGRSSSVTDIWIDFFGVMIGLSVAFLLLCVCRMFWILYQNRD